MIRDFKCRETEKIFNDTRSKKLPQNIQKVAKKKLILLDASEQMEDLKAPPSNRLEKLSGNRQGQYSIRINDQWRICFTWKPGEASNVEIVDYH